MIFCDRTQIQLPDELYLIAAQATERVVAVQSYSSHQERTEFKSEVWQKFKPYLRQLFHGKCAFCESRLDAVTFGEIEHFRPKTDARQLNGETSPAHYFWLAYQWSNMYYSCQKCNYNKRTTFPVLGERASPDSLEHERVLLIDPCFDHPEHYLVFLPDGFVQPRELTEQELKKYDGIHRGEVTIQVFGLNRPELVAARRQTASDVLNLQKLLSLTPSAAARSSIRDQLERFTSPEAEFSAVAIQALSRIERVQPEVGRQPKRAEFEVRPACVTRVEIDNFRAVESLAFDLTLGMKKWKVLLGENATGKTSVLHAIALGLMGERFAQSKFSARKWLTRKNGKTAREGRICLQLSTEERIEIAFSRSGMRFEHGAGGAKTFVRGYGAIRLSARQALQNTPASMNVDNLWDMHRKLPSARTWAASMKEEQIQPTLIALRDLLLLPPDTPVKRKRHGLEIPLHGSRFNTDELSAGYQDMLNVVVDVISGFPGGLSDMRNAYGVLLMDEIGGHLHPRWKMQVVASLKSCFPGVQFIGTTHDPLCLRELDADEVVVMQRDEKGTYAVTDLPSPRNMRVDQLLTSRFFGLQSTVDASLDAEFREYYQLLGDPNAKTSERFLELKNKLAHVSALGYTLRDQKLYELIDQFLADEIKEHRRLGEIEIPAELRERIRAEWKRMTDMTEEAQ